MQKLDAIYVATCIHLDLYYIVWVHGLTIHMVYYLYIDAATVAFISYSSCSTHVANRYSLRFMVAYGKYPTLRMEPKDKLNGTFLSRYVNHTVSIDLMQLTSSLT